MEEFIERDRFRFVNVHESHEVKHILILGGAGVDFLEKLLSFRELNFAVLILV
jgi:hypothetical protein